MPPPAVRFPWNLVTGVGTRKKLARRQYHSVKKIDDMSIWFYTYRHWTDRQTDRQTALVKQYHALHADARYKRADSAVFYLYTQGVCVCMRVFTSRLQMSPNLVTLT